MTTAMLVLQIIGLPLVVGSKNINSKYGEHYNSVDVVFEASLPGFPRQRWKAPA